MFPTYRIRMRTSLFAIGQLVSIGQLCACGQNDKNFVHLDESLGFHRRLAPRTSLRHAESPVGRVVSQKAGCGRVSSGLGEKRQIQSVECQDEMCRAVNIRAEISGRKVREMDIQGQAASATHQQPEVNYLPRFSPQLI